MGTNIGEALETWELYFLEIEQMTSLSEEQHQALNDRYMSNLKSFLMQSDLCLPLIIQHLVNAETMTDLHF